MKDRDEILDHNYDGIQEFDNDLPKWWVWLFWITIIWGGVYAVWFHYAIPPTEERLAVSLQALKGQAKAAPVSTDSEESLKVLAADPARIQAGAKIFAEKCAACHAAAGQGLVGPNLTDNFWIHGGSLTAIKKTIVEGVPAKGMIAWKALMPDDQINEAVAFINSIRGTNPPNPKAPEGAPLSQ